LKLKQDIDSGLAKCDVSFDKKPFSPHMTIGRIKSPVMFKTEIVETLDFKDSFWAREILLMKSDLYSDGPVYSKLYNFKLG